MAISAVSRSRISPTMMTFGSPRRMLRSPLAKVRLISGLTAIWITPEQLILDRIFHGHNAALLRVQTR